MGSRNNKITTRFCSVQVSGASAGLFPIAVPPRVRVELRKGGHGISRPISASYGFEEATGDVQLQLSAGENGAMQTESDTITLTVVGDVAAGPASIHLLDAVTGAELARLEDVEIDISL